VFNAFHKEFDKVDKYKKLYLIGQIHPNETLRARLDGKTPASAASSTSDEKALKEIAIRQDFDEVRQAAVDMV
jgi:hypothetical protein